MNELESIQLARMIDCHGLRGVLDALATEADRRSQTAREVAHACVYSHDAQIIRQVVPRLWTSWRER